MTLVYPNIIPLQLRINRMGYVTLNPKWNKSNGRITSSRLYLIEEGSGYLKTDTETIPLEPGYAYLIPAHFKHAYGCTSLKKFYLVFSLTTTDDTDTLAAVGKVCRMRYDRQDLDTLLAHYQSTDLHSILTVRQTVFKLVDACLQANDVPPITLSLYSPLVEKAIAYIQKNLRLTLTIGQISSHLFVSESKLRAAFLAEVGINIGQYIDSQVLLRARQLLATQRSSISEISAMLGFCDPFYFSRRFKEKHGLSPSAYRKALQKIAAK